MPFGSIVRSIANLRRWRGETPKVLQAGRVDAHVGSVAAGLVGIKSIQRGFSSVAVSRNTATVTLPNAVTPSKSFVVIISMLQGEDSAIGLSNAERITLAREVRASVYLNIAAMARRSFEITGATTMTISGQNGSVNFEWQVVEGY